MNTTRLCIAAAALATLTACAGTGGAPGPRGLTGGGNDEKPVYSDGKTPPFAPAKGRVPGIYMATTPRERRLIANLPLINRTTGPPTNLAITPDQGLALVGNSMDW